jgi:hypothetical protein
MYTDGRRGKWQYVSNALGLNDMNAVYYHYRDTMVRTKPHHKKTETIGVKQRVGKRKRRKIGEEDRTKTEEDLGNVGAGSVEEEKKEKEEKKEEEKEEDDSDDESAEEKGSGRGSLGAEQELEVAREEDDDENEDENEDDYNDEDENGDNQEDDECEDEAEELEGEEMQISQASSPLTSLPPSSSSSSSLPPATGTFSSMTTTTTKDASASSELLSVPMDINSSQPLSTAAKPLQKGIKPRNIPWTEDDVRKLPTSTKFTVDSYPQIACQLLFHCFYELPFLMQINLNCASVCFFPATSKWFY